MNKAMKTVSAMLMTVAIPLLVLPAVGQQASQFDFRKDEDFRDELLFMGRCWPRGGQSKAPARVWWGGTLLTKKSFGPGIYQIRYIVDESHPKFEYNTNEFIFYFQPENDLDTSTHAGEQGAYLALEWEKTGEVKFHHYAPPGTGKDNRKTTLGYWMKPGPTPETELSPGKLSEFTLRVPPAGEWLELYLNQSTTEGSPDCRFRMPESPTEGRFGFINYKWWSRVYIQQLSYRPLPE